MDDDIPTWVIVALVVMSFAAVFMIIATLVHADEDPEGYVPGNCTVNGTCNESYNVTVNQTRVITDAEWHDLVDQLIDQYNNSIDILMQLKNTSVVHNETKYYSWIALSGEAFEKWLTEKSQLDEQTESNMDLREKLDLLDRETFELRKQNLQLQAEMLEIANTSNTLAIYYNVLKVENIKMQEEAAVKERVMASYIQLGAAAIIVIGIIRFFAWRIKFGMGG